MSMWNSFSNGWRALVFKLGANRLINRIKLQVTENSIELYDCDGVVGLIDFAIVPRIVAFKRDLLTTDLVCLVFSHDGPEPFLIHEEMPGFSDVLPAMTNAFQGLDAEWYFRVMQPPFATNETTIWERPH